MNRRAVRIYVFFVVALAVGAALVQDWSVFGQFGLQDRLGWTILLVLGLVSESLTLPIQVGRTAGSTSSIVFIPQLAVLLLFGPAAAVLFMAVTGVVGEFIIRRKPALKAIFNSAQYVFSTFVAGWIFQYLGGKPLALTDIGIAKGFQSEFLAFVAFGIAFVVVNNAAVAVAVALSEGARVGRVWHQIVGRSGTNLFYDVLVSPIAFAVVALYVVLPIFGPLLVVLPLLFIRLAYLTIVQLQQANRDLVTALVKAIETRDPYTSGHSIRVKGLSSRIADALGLSAKKQIDVEQAALLHDIGKIEAAYSEILRKPAGLTEEEREIIESHVMKGVELLQSLSSFSRDVVSAVKSHHERVDGRGYPDGLKGDQIPIAARIIKVCDAVDAMLSDRPYRKALALEQVREQLVIYAGTQFDLEVVKATIEGNLLEAHQAEIMLQKPPERIPRTDSSIPRRVGTSPS